jgi:hypothetical protein
MRWEDQEWRTERECWILLTGLEPAEKVKTDDLPKPGYEINGVERCIRKDHPLSPVSWIRQFGKIRI